MVRIDSIPSCKPRDSHSPKGQYPPRRWSRQTVGEAVRDDRRCVSTSASWPDRDSTHGNKKRMMTLTVDEFLRRFLLHLLPRGLMRIRNFGFLVNRRRAELLPLCFRLLQPSDQPAVAASHAVLPIFPRRTAIAVAFRLIPEPLWTVERTVLSVDTVAGAHIRNDAALRQPSQKLPVPVRRIGGHRLGLASLPLRETRLLTIVLVFLCVVRQSMNCYEAISESFSAIEKPELLPTCSPYSA